MKVSLKLGLWFFICTVIIEMISMFYLHSNIIHSRVNQELQSLQARGNNHRDVLEISSDLSTLHHIGLMESNTDTEVVITNLKGKIILASGPVDKNIKHILEMPIKQIPRKGRILQPDWMNEKYIATVTEFNGGVGHKGYVYMFKNTNDVQKLISELNQHFILASVLILFFMLFTIFFLSKALTKPLISMIEATKKLSKGNFSVKLPVRSKDELGELSTSIQTLANDLNFLKTERNEFLASVSHELRTPITYIKGYADIAGRPGIDETERAQYLKIIKEEGERLSNLLEELFNLAKLDQNEFTINKARINLSDFLRSIYERILPAFNNKGIKLIFECIDNIYLQLDPVRFEQILTNLLDNALKYSKGDTSTYIKAFKIDGNVHLLIQDEGIGIPKEDLSFIFDRLYRVEKSRSRATGGFGIGLAIVKELVEAQGGQISVISEIGQGTCFTIIFREDTNENSVIS
ncbi:ATP-binding protein [Bacillus sp. MUM 116]|uniref:sensor histidine kinase n=1 Tax=Bacillus sp. MUM 116 TaxID=1678002 RepID=UPI000A7CCB61